MNLRQPAPYQVLQRGTGDTALVRVEGAVEHQGRIRVIDRNGDSLAGADVRARTVGVEFELPVGGPYELVEETTGERVGPFHVGDLWVLAGQSNMEGTGVWREPGLAHPSVQVFGQGGRWANATEPVHNGWSSRFPAHWPEPLPLDQRLQRAALRSSGGEPAMGCAMAFGRSMVEVTGVPIGLLPCAAGGRSLAQWDERLAKLGGDSLFGALLATVRDAGGRVAGVLWHQGESDTFTPELAAAYGRGTERLLTAMRAALGDVPIYVAQLGRTTLAPAVWTGWSAVREHQRHLSGSVAAAVIATTDLDLDDDIHLSAVSQERLGRRFACVASGRRPPLRVGSVSVRLAEPRTVRIQVDGVVGQLRVPAGHTGFTVLDPKAQPRDCIESVRTDACGSGTLLLTLSDAWNWGDTVSFGLGHNPTGCLLDDGDFALPSFGPLAPEHE